MSELVADNNKRCGTCRHFRVRKSHTIGECVWMPIGHSPIWLDRHVAEMYRTEGSRCETWDHMPDIETYKSLQTPQSDKKTNQSNTLPTDD